MLAYRIALLVALAADAPDVRGVGSCPSAEQVAGRLRSLLPGDGALPTGAWLEIAAQPPEIELRMMAGAPPRLLGARRLSASGSCDEAAQAVAVVAASWLATYLSPPPLWFGDSRPAAPAAKGEARPPHPTVAVEVRSGGAAAGGAPLTCDLGAAFGFTTGTAGTTAPFVTAELDVGRRRASGARLSLMGFGARTMSLGSGQVAWRRLMAGVGVARAWGTPAAHVQIGGDVLTGATFIDGRGFADNASTTSCDAAVGPSVRAGARLAALPVTVWAGAQALVWARAQRVRVTDVVSDDTLPRLDLLGGVGLTWNIP
jgi:hypothetical protein